MAYFYILIPGFRLPPLRASLVRTQDGDSSGPSDLGPARASAPGRVGPARGARGRRFNPNSARLGAVSVSHDTTHDSHSLSDSAQVIGSGLGFVEMFKITIDNPFSPIPFIYASPRDATTTRLTLGLKLGSSESQRCSCSREALLCCASRLSGLQCPWRQQGHRR